MIGFLWDRAVRALQQRQRPHDTAPPQTQPFVDPQHRALSSALQLQKIPHIVVGVIDDYTSHAYCYRLRPSEGLGGPLLAVQLSHTAFGAFGAKDVGMYTPGAQVLVLKLSQSYGFILGAFPFSAYDPRRCLSDQLTYATRTRTDSAHRKPITTGDGRNLINWIANRPFDMIAGTHGWMTPNGMRITLNDRMAQLGVGEACGLTTFYNDMLLRLAAYNYQHWTAVREHYSMNDQEELLDYTGFAVYPWEQLGLLKRGDPRRELEPEAWQLKEPWYAHWEPKKDQQCPFHRIREFHGYLGQGSFQTVVAPPADPPEVLQLDQPQKTFGVARDFTTLSGDRCIMAARSISLVKRITIANPERLKRAEDGRGDKPENYKHSGEVGDGPPHRVTPLKADGDKPHLSLVAGILDMHAYMANWAGTHPFHYHTKDWDLPQEDAITFRSDPVKTQFKFDYTKLRTSIFLDPPTPQTLLIDERIGLVDYYETLSHVTQTPDGSIVIGNGYGAEIRLAGADIILSAPGDVWLRSGRNLIAWAGWDAITRAQNSIDLSATKRDVRIKAEKNMQVLAAEGGILVESKAVGATYDYTQTGEKVISSGIMFRAAKSEVVTTAQNIYLRTGSEDNSILGGDITIDAHRGKRSIVTHALQQEHYVRGSFNLYYGEEGNIAAAHVFNRTNTILSGSLYAEDYLSCGKDVLVDGQIAVAGGGIAVASGSPFVGKLEGTPLAKLKNQLGNFKQLAETTYPQEGTDSYQTLLEDAFYVDRKVGNDTVLRQAGFSFRAEEEYLVSDFQLYEDRWHQAARSDSWSDFWEERPVRTQNNQDTYPYPGRTAYTEDCYYEQPLLLFDDATGWSKPRGELYERPRQEAPVKKPLKQYPVIKRAT